MTTHIADAWAYLKTVPNIIPILFVFFGTVVGLIGTLIVALINARVSLRITRATLAQAKEGLEVQRLASNRSTASFIADKRQKWIDELRADMASHLAESQEIIWKWAAVRATANELQDDTSLTEDEREKRFKVIFSEFSKANSELDRKHQERHHRLRFRLNPKEQSHITLRRNLDEIRKILVQTNPNSRFPAEQAKNMNRVKKLVLHSDDLTNVILKREWERVKQEVAYPEKMIAKIFPP